MTHTNYQPARKGLIDSRIASEKRIAITATLKNPDSKSSLMRTLYGGQSENSSSLILRIDPTCGLMEYQRSRLKYSERGDFTGCYRGSGPSVPGR